MLAGTVDRFSKHMHRPRLITAKDARFDEAPLITGLFEKGDDLTCSRVELAQDLRSLPGQELAHPTQNIFFGALCIDLNERRSGEITALSGGIEAQHRDGNSSTNFLRHEPRCNLKLWNLQPGRSVVGTYGSLHDDNMREAVEFEVMSEGGHSFRSGLESHDTSTCTSEARKQHSEETNVGADVVHGAARPHVRGEDVLDVGLRRAKDVSKVCTCSVEPEPHANPAADRGIASPQRHRHEISHALHTLAPSENPPGSENWS